MLAWPTLLACHSFLQSLVYQMRQVYVNRKKGCRIGEMVLFGPRTAASECRVAVGPQILHEVTYVVLSVSTLIYTSAKVPIVIPF